MPVIRKKASTRERQPEPEEKPALSAMPRSNEEAEDDDESHGPDLAGIGSEQHSDADQRRVDALADRIFSSVLARSGWARNERGELEHVGTRR